MNLQIFLKLVEIQTKVASVFPFLIGIAYTKYRYDTISFPNIIIMFLSLICIDMATTAINNFMDYKRAVKKKGYNYEIHNAIGQYNLKEKQVITVIILLLLLASVFGIILVILTDGLVLLLGIISFGIGILYSYGPFPLSRTPLGEIFSGVAMGFLITLLTIYISIYDQGIILFTINQWHFILNIDVREILIIFFVSLPLVICISNIMLANNICDLKDDIENKRFTLPYYIGKRNALNIFRLSYYVAYIDILILSIIKILPWTALLVLLTLIPIYSLIKSFMKVQTKKDTFVVAVKSFTLMSITYLVSILIGVLLK